MKKLINRVEDVLNEQLAGLAKAYPSWHCIRTQCMSPAQMHR
jgi:dihydroxyacetone kinase